MVPGGRSIGTMNSTSGAGALVVVTVLDPGASRS